MPLQSFGFEYKADADKRTFEGYASTFGNVDNHADVILPGAFAKSIKTRFPANQIKILWQHMDPIGLPVHLEEDETGLFVRGKISKTRLGDEALELMRDGVVDRLSIGFMIPDGGAKINDESLVREISEVDLREFSPVTFPANEEAGITAVKALAFAERYGEKNPGFAIIQTKDDDGRPVSIFVPSSYVAKEDGSSVTITLQAKEEPKQVVQFQDLPLAGRRRAWDASAAERRVREFTDSEEIPSSDYWKAFAWFDRENRDTFGAYKLPIADVIDGELKAVPRAVFAAAGAIEGARGGVDIPDADIPQLRVELGRYYESMRDEFDDDSIIPPWEQEGASGDDADSDDKSDSDDESAETPLTREGEEDGDGSEELSEIVSLLRGMVGELREILEGSKASDDDEDDEDDMKADEESDEESDGDESDGTGSDDEEEEETMSDDEKGLFDSIEAALSELESIGKNPGE